MLDCRADIRHDLKVLLSAFNGFKTAGYFDLHFNITNIPLGLIVVKRNLAVLSEPDHVIHHLHTDCQNCPKREQCMKNSAVKEARHEIDIIVQVDVTEHELITIPVCPICGDAKTGSFPAHIKATVQYGQNLESLAIALNTVGAVSFNRTHDILSGVFNIPISVGTIKNMVSHCAVKVKEANAISAVKLKSSHHKHADETGCRADGKTR